MRRQAVPKLCGGMVTAQIQHPVPKLVDQVLACGANPVREDSSPARKKHEERRRFRVGVSCRFPTTLGLLHARIQLESLELGIRTVVVLDSSQSFIA
jgi:hypothetical protein